ncbi:VWA domain-containing protein, partial [Desulfovibrio sp. OttesenSCG-928-A18]|nr:VWA domain-containing protein [Desulfovibrio sp. OttesenSCG-928-A18]
NYWTVNVMDGNVKLGVMYIGPDGSYDFIPEAGVNLPRKTLDNVFTYTIRDAEGDASTASFSLSFAGDVNIVFDDDPSLNSGDYSVSEKGLVMGDGSEKTGSSHFLVDFDGAEPGTITLNIGGRNVELLTGQGYPAEFRLDHGILTIKDVLSNGDKVRVEYEYHIETAQTHGATGTATDEVLKEREIVITAISADGVQNNATIQLSVYDDAPEVEFIDSLRDTPEDAYDIGAGSTMTGTLDIYENADGIVSISINGVDISAGTTASPAIINDQSGGTLKVWDDNGTWRYSYTAKEESQVNNEITDLFTITVVDADGDSASDTMTVKVHPGKISVGTNDDNSYDNNNPWHEGGGTGQLIGGKGNDVIIGDAGGAGKVQDPTNVTFIMDYSKSMTEYDGLPQTRMWYMKEAVKNMLVQYAKEEGSDIKVCLVAFYSKARDPKTIQFTKDMTLEQRMALVTNTLLEQYLDFGTWGADNRTTTYEAGIALASQWLQGRLYDKPLADATNKTIFLSDGQPNSTIDKGIYETTFNTALQAALNNGGYYAYLREHSDIRAIGIALREQESSLYQNSIIAINALDKTGQGIDTKDASEIWDAVENAGKLEGAAVGSDYIVGGDGDNIIFADVINTDALSNLLGVRNQDGNRLIAGMGWFVFEELEREGWSGSFTYDG